MISELTNPHNMSVTARANAAGQAVGSGNFSGRGWFQPGRKRQEAFAELRFMLMLPP